MESGAGCGGSVATFLADARGLVAGGAAEDRVRGLIREAGDAGLVPLIGPGKARRACVGHYVEILRHVLTLYASSV